MNGSFPSFLWLLSPSQSKAVAGLLWSTNESFVSWSYFTMAAPSSALNKAQYDYLIKYVEPPRLGRSHFHVLFSRMSITHIHYPLLFRRLLVIGDSGTCPADPLFCFGVVAFLPSFRCGLTSGPLLVSGVGKSSLLLRFDEDKFTPNFITTIGYALASTDSA